MRPEESAHHQLRREADRLVPTGPLARSRRSGPARPQAVRLARARRLRVPRGWPLIVLLALAVFWPTVGSGNAESGIPIEDAAVTELPFSDEVLSAGASAPAAPSDARAGNVAPEPPPPDEGRVAPPPPSRPPTLYDLAGRRYGISPTVLHALHQVESNAASDGCLPNRQGSGARGPFQFKPATFRAYGVDADGDGRADICGFVDSLYSAARYLEALGANSDPTSAGSRRALERYGTDTERVAALVSGPLRATAAGGDLRLR